MITKKTSKLIFCTLPLALLFGCTNPVHQTTKKNPGDTSPLPELKRVYMSSTLAKNLEVISVNQATANGDLLKIQVNLQNLSKKEMNLNYKVEWMDEAGIVINDSSAVWMPLFIRGAENVAVQSVSSSTRAKNFWLKLQKAK
tara:strand:+ start:333 stop:758 length:426 start_codon:yes stop_codon:yes gene_type:complete